jgi:hypothetical protein
MDKEQNTSTPEEQKAEEEALTETKEEEIREKVMQDLALDPDVDSELIDNLVKREISQREKLSEAIRQKINWRKKVQEKEKDSRESNESNSNPESNPAESKTKPMSDEESKIRAILEEERLEDMDVPDELKQEIRQVSKVKNIGVKKAAQDPYILHRKKEFEAAAKAQEASINYTKKGQQVDGTIDPKNPPKFDHSTKEGRRQAREWRKKVAEQYKE